MNYLQQVLIAFLFSTAYMRMIHASELTVTRRRGADAILKELAREGYKQKITQDPSYREYLLIQNFLNHIIAIQKPVQRESSGRTWLEVAPLSAISPDYLQNPCREGVFVVLNKKKIDILHRWGVVSPYKTISFTTENDYVFFLNRLFTCIDTVFVGIEHNEPLEDTHLLAEYTITDEPEKKILAKLLSHQEIDAAQGSINKLFGFPWKNQNGGSIIYQLIKAGDIHSEIIVPPLPPLCSREFKSRDDCRVEWHDMTKLYKVAQEELQ